MHVKIMPWCLRETPVLVRHKLSGKGVGRVGRTDVRQPELFDQPVLQREMRTLHTAFGRVGVSAYADRYYFDVRSSLNASVGLYAVHFVPEADIPYSVDSKSRTTRYACKERSVMVLS